MVLLADDRIRAVPVPWTGTNSGYCIHQTLCNVVLAVMVIFVLKK